MKYLILLFALLLIGCSINFEPDYKIVSGYEKSSFGNYITIESISVTFQKDILIVKRFDNASTFNVPASLQEVKNAIDSTFSTKGINIIHQAFYSYHFDNDTLIVNGIKGILQRKTETTSLYKFEPGLFWLDKEVEYWSISNF